MIQADKILKTIRLTEKSNKLSSNYGQYTFEVFPSATKYTVRGTSKISGGDGQAFTTTTTSTVSSTEVSGSSTSVPSR